MWRERAKRRRRRRCHCQVNGPRPRVHVANSESIFLALLIWTARTLQSKMESKRRPKTAIELTRALEVIMEVLKATGRGERGRENRFGAGNNRAAGLLVEHLRFSSILMMMHQSSCGLHRHLCKRYASFSSFFHSRVTARPRSFPRPGLSWTKICVTSGWFSSPSPSSALVVHPSHCVQALLH